MGSLKVWNQNTSQWEYTVGVGQAPPSQRMAVTAPASVPTPPAGATEEFSADGVALWMKDSTGYVSKVGSLSVRAVITVNLALSAIPTSGNADGVSLVAGDRVLLTAQTNAAENGVWDVAAGAWTRTAGYESARGIAATDLVTCREGTNNGGTVWTTSFKATDTLGTTAQNWYRVLDTSRVGVASGVEAYLAPGAANQYYRGDKTWQTLDRNAVGLGQNMVQSGTATIAFSAQTSVSKGVTFPVAFAASCAISTTAAGTTNVYMCISGRSAVGVTLTGQTRANTAYTASGIAFDYVGVAPAYAVP